MFDYQVLLSDKNEKLISGYTDYLSKTAGLMKGTIYNRVYNTRKFLAAQEKRKKFDVGKLKPVDVEKYFFKIADQYERSTLGNSRTTVRSFFRYLHMKGLAPEVMSRAVPAMPKWSLSQIPDHLTEEQTDQLLSSFNRKNPEGRRNYAMAMILVHLGLRSGEVAAIEIDDVDWKNGILNVRNLKCRRMDPLPLPKQVGEAMVDYIKNGRPPSKHKQIFVNHRFERGSPIHSKNVQANMTYQFRKHRMKLPSYGTHIIRRTVAGRMIQNGASLKEIADVLRHRDLDTTKIYTKVNLPLLREVALEWPWGGV